MNTSQFNLLHVAMASLGVGSLVVAGAFAAKGGKPPKPPKDDGALRIPVCITFANSVHDVAVLEGQIALALGDPQFALTLTPKITSDPIASPTYCDGDLKGKVSAWVGGNTAPEQILFDSNTSRKADAGRTVSFDVDGIDGIPLGASETEFQSEWDVDFQGMAAGEIKSIGARFIIPSASDKNRCLLTFGDTAPSHSEPSCEGVANSQAYVLALSDDAPQDGTIDRWVIWADDAVNVCLIQYDNWAVLPAEIVNAPFAMLVEKMD